MPCGCRKSARSLHKNHACTAQTEPAAGFGPGIRRVSSHENSVAGSGFARSTVPSKLSGTRPAHRRTRVGRDQERHSRQAALGDRQGRRHGDQARLVQGGGAGAARPHRASLAHHRKAELRRRPQAGLLPQPGIPDRPSVHRCPEQYGAVAGVRGGTRRSRRRALRIAQMRAGCGARQWRPRAAGGVLHGEHGDAGDPRHRLRHPLRFRPVPPDHLAGLAAGISRRMARLRQPLGIPAAGSGLSRAFRRRRRTCRGQGPRPRDLASGRDREGGRLRHPDRRLARPARQRAAAVVGALARSAQARRLQHRRLSRRQRRGSPRRIDLQIPLSERREPGGPRAAAAPGIFLRLGLAAGSGQPPSGLRRTIARAGVEGRGAAQRHPSEPRRHRADAYPGRPAQFPLGRCVADHGGDVVLHQPHAAAGSARDLAGRTVRAAAAAPSGNHLPHQCRASGAGGQRAPRRRRFQGLGVADRRAVRPQGADGTTGVRRIAPHQRRLGDAFRPDEGDRVPRSQSSLSRRASPTRPTASPSAAG